MIKRSRVSARAAAMLAAAALVVAFAAACGSDNNSTSNNITAAPTATTAAAAPTAGSASDASIKILSPADGWSPTGDRMDVQVAVTGLKLDGTKIGLPAAQNPGVGHWHIYVDGKYAGLSVSDVISLPNDAMPSIPAGPHEIKVQLHNTDHTPLQPEATDTINVNFPTALTEAAPSSSQPSIKIVSPATGTTTGKRTVVQVAISGLKLDGTKIGLPAAQNPGVGHWHIYVDGKYAGLSVSDVISLPNDAMPVIAPGPHEIKVQLHNTDHTPLQPEVTDTEMLTFQ
ncbi:MAG TPA: hypothetical protein VFY79_10615 [Dehalococcoidia bacterium]|nr:hypothetical protein [Dehalococcoidia bacterium]